MAGKAEKGKRVIHKWTKDEINTVLNYMMDTIQKGYEIEKPTAMSYYQKIIEATSLPTTIKAKSMLDKMNKIRNSFKLACVWEKQTGQGVKEADGMITFRAALLNRCAYYDQCQIIWGTKANINIPYVSTSTANKSCDLESHETHSTTENDVESVRSPRPSRSPSRSPNRSRSRSPPTSFTESQTVNEDSDSQVSEVFPLTPRPSTSDSTRQSAVAASLKLKSLGKSKGKPTSSEIVQEFVTSRYINEESKLEVQKTQLKLDELKHKTKLAFMQEKFQHKKFMEMERIDADKEMLKMKLEADEKMMAFKIRELELQIELARENKNNIM